MFGHPEKNATINEGFGKNTQRAMLFYRSGSSQVTLSIYHLSLCQANKSDLHRFAKAQYFIDNNGRNKNEQNLDSRYRSNYRATTPL